MRKATSSSVSTNPTMRRRRSAATALQDRALPGVEEEVYRRDEEDDEKNERIEDDVVEVVVREGDLIADPGARQDKLGADDTDERIGDGQLHPGEDVRGGRGQDDEEHRRAAAHLVGARHLSQHRRDAVEAV